MRYVNHKFGRACVHRPRREDRGKEGEREREKKRRTRERERARKGCEEIRACEEEKQRGIRRDRRGGEGKETSRRVWVLKNAEGTKREGFSVVDESRFSFRSMIDDPCDRFDVSTRCQLLLTFSLANC